MMPGVTIGRNHLFLFLGTLLVLGSIFFVAAYDSNPGNPAVLGHTANEIGPGTVTPFITGGSSTLSGGPTSWFNIPGYLTIGPKSLNQTNNHNLHVYDPDESAGIVIETGNSVGNGAPPNNVYLDFMVNNVLKANIDFNTGRLLINGNPSTQNTNVAIGNGAGTAKLGVGKDATTERVEVRGNVQADGFCIGASCLSSWPGSINIDNEPNFNVPASSSAGETNCMSASNPTATYTATFTIASAFIRYRDPTDSTPTVDSLQPVLLTSADNNAGWRLVFSESGGTSSPTNVAARIVNGNTIQLCRDFDGSWNSELRAVDIVAFG